MIDQIERNEGAKVLERARENQKVNSFRRKGQRIERKTRGVIPKVCREGCVVSERGGCLGRGKPRESWEGGQKTD